MLLNVLDWLRDLKFAYSAGNPSVKFSPDGSFGVASKGFVVFGKSIALHQEIAFAEIDQVIKDLKCVSRIEVNVEINDGLLTIGDDNKTYYCLLAPPATISNSIKEDFEKSYLDDWIEFPIVIESLKALAKTIRSRKSRFVGFNTKNGRLVAYAGDVSTFWEVTLAIGTIPIPYVMDAEKLLRVLDVLDVSTVFVSFRTYDKRLMKIVIKDYPGNSVVWYLAALTYKNEWQTQKQQRLLLPANNEL